jgi:hypothetical protein
MTESGDSGNRRIKDIAQWTGVIVASVEALERCAWPSSEQN